MSSNTILVFSDKPALVKELLSEARRQAASLGWAVAVVGLGKNASALADLGADVLYQVDVDDRNPELVAISTYRAISIDGFGHCPALFCIVWMLPVSPECSTGVRPPPSGPSGSPAAGLPPAGRSLSCGTNVPEAPDNEPSPPTRPPATARKGAPDNRSNISASSENVAISSPGVKNLSIPRTVFDELRDPVGRAFESTHVGALAQDLRMDVERNPMACVHPTHPVVRDGRAKAPRIAPEQAVMKEIVADHRRPESAFQEESR